MQSLSLSLSKQRHNVLLLFSRLTHSHTQTHTHIVRGNQPRPLWSHSSSSPSIKGARQDFQSAERTTFPTRASGRLRHSHPIQHPQSHACAHGRRRAAGTIIHRTGYGEAHASSPTTPTTFSSLAPTIVVYYDDPYYNNRPELNAVVRMRFTG